MRLVYPLRATDAGRRARDSPPCGGEPGLARRAFGLGLVSGGLVFACLAAVAVSSCRVEVQRRGPEPRYGKFAAGQLVPPSRARKVPALSAEKPDKGYMKELEKLEKEDDKKKPTAEVVYYEGPPSKFETIIPTLSIVTVVGIFPAAGSWARQAWVRYRITNRRVRVNSGIGGKDMTELVWQDIKNIRMAKRFFGDGDLVFTLRDGARFEMKSVPEIEATMEFILEQVKPDVAQEWTDFKSSLAS